MVKREGIPWKIKIKINRKILGKTKQYKRCLPSRGQSGQCYDALFTEFLLGFHWACFGKHLQAAARSQAEAKAERPDSIQ